MESAMSLIPENVLSGAHRSLAGVGLDHDLPPIRRNAEGGVDYEHYLARGRALRSESWRKAFALIGRGLFGWVGAWRAWQARKRAIAELGSMDDRMLRDMGLGRAGIIYAIDHGREDIPAPANTNAETKKPHAA
jgi:uncharacterized protein YjiS (DUF1127 family)